MNRTGTAFSSHPSGAPLPSRFSGAGNTVYCVAPAVGTDGLPDFALLRRLLSELGTRYTRGELRSAHVVCGEHLSDALTRMSGNGLSFRLSDSVSLFDSTLPLAILLETGGKLPYTPVAEVTEQETEPTAEEELPALPETSLIWSDPREAVLVAVGQDTGAQALSALLSHHGMRCSLFDETADAGPLSRAILTARIVILCGNVSLPDSDQMRFALRTQQAAGGILLSVGDSPALPPELPAIRLPNGISEALFNRLTAL